MVIPSLEPIERAGQCYRGSSEPTGTWPVLGQHLGRATLADRQVRGGLHQGICRWHRTIPGLESIFQLLQPSSPSSGARLSYASRPIPKRSYPATNGPCTMTPADNCFALAHSLGKPLVSHSAHRPDDQYRRTSSTLNSGPSCPTDGVHLTRSSAADCGDWTASYADSHPRTRTVGAGFSCWVGRGASGLGTTVSWAWRRASESTLERNQRRILLMFRGFRTDFTAPSSLP